MPPLLRPIVRRRRCSLHYPRRSLFSRWGGGRSKDVAASGAARRNYCYQPAPAASAPTDPSVRLENFKLDESELARMEAKPNTLHKRFTSQNLYAERAARHEHRETPMQEGDQPRMEWGGGRSKNVAASGAARRNYYYQPAPAASAPNVPSYVRLENFKLDESELSRMEAKKEHAAEEVDVAKLIRRACGSTRTSGNTRPRTVEVGPRQDKSRRKG